MWTEEEGIENVILTKGIYNPVKLKSFLKNHPRIATRALLLANEIDARLPPGWQYKRPEMIALAVEELVNAGELRLVFT